MLFMSLVYYEKIEKVLTKIFTIVGIKTEILHFVRAVITGLYSFSGLGACFIGQCFG